MLKRKRVAAAAMAVLMALAVTGCKNAANGGGSDSGGSGGGGKWSADSIGINMVSVTGGEVPLLIATSLQ